MRQECNAEKPITPQLLCMQKMKRCHPQDKNQLEPQKFFNLMVIVNDLIPWIDPIVIVNKKLTNEEVHHTLTQSISSKWELEAKNSGFVNDRIRIF